MSDTHELRRRCPCCRKKRRFHEPPGDQGGTRQPKIGWAKVNNVWQCPRCTEHPMPCRPKKSVFREGSDAVNDKKRIRQQFRDAVFARDKNRCRVCGWTKRLGTDVDLDAHHVTDRNEMPFGGYVVENGISLCPDCHVEAEAFHLTGASVPGYSPDELYELIGSSYELAIIASEKLKT